MQDRLYLQGRKELLRRPAVSVIGSRKSSPEGNKRAAAATRTLVSSGYVIMSGLACGIDSMAHRTALQCGGDTIAVLPSSVDDPRPRKNRALAMDIAELGLIVSCTAPDEQYTPGWFPRRNRLMARLSAATVIIEAGLDSGTRHQANECMRLGKPLIFSASLAEKDYYWVRASLEGGAGIAHDCESLMKLIGKPVRETFAR